MSSVAFVGMLCEGSVFVTRLWVPDGRNAIWR
jgi:hypothetical protein